MRWPLPMFPAPSSLPPISTRIFKSLKRATCSHIVFSKSLLSSGNPPPLLHLTPFPFRTQYRCHLSRKPFLNTSLPPQTPPTPIWVRWPLIQIPKTSWHITNAALVTLCCCRFTSLLPPPWAIWALTGVIHSCVFYHTDRSTCTSSCIMLEKCLLSEEPLPTPWWRPKLQGISEEPFQCP